MRLLYKSLIIIVFLGTGFIASAQQESAYADEEYEVENVFGIKNATNGGLISAILFRHSRKINENSLLHLGIEIANTKHPRESRSTTFTGSNFILGKSNYLFSIRPTYGREKIFFKKAPQQGVRISGLVAAGPSIGLESPYFVDLGGTTAQFDPTIHRASDIQGNAGPFRGLFRSQVVLGGYFKAALTFETNSSKSRVFGVEAGFNIEAFTREIIIIPDASRKSTYTAAFIGIYFGRRR